LTEVQMGEALLAPFAVSKGVRGHDTADAGFARRDTSAYADVDQPIYVFVDTRQASPRDITIGVPCDSDTVRVIAVLGAAGNVMVDCRGHAAYRDTSAIVEFVLTWDIVAAGTSSLAGVPRVSHRTLGVRLDHARDRSARQMEKQI
jgi:hypothetical protein